jgi:hypothetical protein
MLKTRYDLQISMIYKFVLCVCVNKKFVRGGGGYEKKGRHKHTNTKNWVLFLVMGARVCVCALCFCVIRTLPVSDQYGFSMQPKLEHAWSLGLLETRSLRSKKQTFGWNVAVWKGILAPYRI